MSAAYGTHLLEKYKNVDPIDIVKKEILKNKITTLEELEKINSEVISEIKAAADYALDSPYPESSDLFTNVYI